MSNTDINHSVMLSFIDLIGMPEFNRKFRYLELFVKDFLLWVEKTSVPDVKNITRKISERLLRRKSEVT